MKISLIIPTYNESKIIEATAKTLSEYMEEMFDDYEIIFSDDGSVDGTRTILEELSLPRVRVVGERENRGKGAAVRLGMLEAEGDVRLFTDADLAYGTEVIGRSAGELVASGADILIGSRNMDAHGYEGYTLKRKLMSKLYIKILCFAGGFHLSDSQCGIKAFTARAAQDVFKDCTVDGFAFDFEVILIALKLGFGITEIPVRIINHRASSVKPLKDSFKMLGDVRNIKKRVRGKTK